MAAAQVPAAYLPVLERPIVGNPVVLQYVTNAIRFVVFGIFTCLFISVYIPTPASVRPHKSGKKSSLILFPTLISVKQLFTSIKIVQVHFLSK